MNAFNLIKLLTSLYSYYQKNKDFFSKEKSWQTQADVQGAKTDSFTNTERSNAKQNDGLFDTGFLRNLFPFFSKPKGTNPNEINASRKMESQSTPPHQNLNPPNPLKKELYATMTNHDLLIERVMKNANKSNPQIKR